MIAADERLVAVLRPQRHSLHPRDLHILFSMLFRTPNFQDGTEHWIPLCLPKFNDKGFLHVYVCFFAPQIAAVLISADKGAFFEMQACKERLLASLQAQSLLAVIEGATTHRYRPTEVSGVLLHFLYKSRRNVQLTMPSLEPHFYTPVSRRRLMSAYRTMHGMLREKGLARAVRVSSPTMVAVGCITKDLEFYCVAGPSITKNELARAAASAMRWAHARDAELFISSGAIF
jgi:hypothetical protein